MLAEERIQARQRLRRPGFIGRLLQRIDEVRGEPLYRAMKLEQRSGRGEAARVSLIESGTARREIYIRGGRAGRLSSTTLAA